MNLRPPGYEPGELPDCSTPRRWAGLYHRYHAAMPLLNWLCLLFLVVSTVGSIAFAAVRGLRTWRAARQLSNVTSTALDEVLRKGEAAEGFKFALEIDQSFELLIETLVAGLAQRPDSRP